MNNTQRTIPDTSYSLATGEDDKERLIILNEVYNPLSSEFLRNCDIKKGDCVLELGCGIGIMSQVLASMVGKKGFVLATDISNEQLEVAMKCLPKRPVPHLHFQQLSAFNVDALERKFDAVYARFLLVHLKDISQLIRKIKSIIKPGGKIIIEDLTGNETAHTLPDCEGMAVWREIDRLQFETQQSDDHYFAFLPQILENEGFELFCSQHVQPMLDSPRKRSMLTCFECLKPLLLQRLKMPEHEFNYMRAKVSEMAANQSIKIYFYELGQICAKSSAP